MKFASRLTVALAVGWMTCFGVLETTAVGQGFGPRRSSNRDDDTRGRAGRGGFGSSGAFGGRSRFAGGVVGALYRAETRAELGLSDDEIRKLQEASRAAMVSGDDDARRDLIIRYRNASSDEERDKIQQQMRDDVAARNKKAEEAIANALGSEKMLRLKQLALQYEGSRALMRDDIVADLNITDAQKAKFAELRNQSIQARRELGFRASPEERASFEKEWDQKYFSVLTQEQRAKWEQKVGRIVKQTGRTVGRAGAGGAGGPSASSVPGRGASSSFSVPVFGGSGVVSALYRVETRAELGLSDDEIRKLQEAAQEALALSSTERREIFNKIRNAPSNEERDKIRKEVWDASAERGKKAEEAIAKALDPEKMLRLKQLALQYEGGPALMRDDVAADLSITDAQKAKLEDLLNQRRDAFREMGFRASPEERASFDKEWDDKLFSILTDEQRAKWAQKVGRIVKPTGQTESIGRPGAGRSTGGSNSGITRGTVSGGGLGQTTVRFEALASAIYREETHDELQLTTDEIRKLYEAAHDARTSVSAHTRPLLDKMRSAGSNEERRKALNEIRNVTEEQNKKGEEAIAKVISPEKMLRWKQLTLQYEGGLALMRNDVAGDLNMTDAQKAEFTELRRQRSKARRELGFYASPEERASFEMKWNDILFSVLTDEQRTKWEQKVGRIVKQTWHTVRIDGLDFNEGSVAGALYRVETRDELGLSDDEMRKLQQTARKVIFSDSAERHFLTNLWRNESNDEERRRIQKESRDASAERVKNTEEAIAKVIGPEKMLRLKQLALQYQGGFALMRDDVVADLNITDAQKAKIEDLLRQRNEVHREMGFRASAEDRASFNKEWDDKTFSILTDEQRAKWEQKVGRIVTPRGQSGNNDASDAK